MILVVNEIQALTGGIPRESGDDPNTEVSIAHVVRYSPRERG